MVTKFRLVCNLSEITMYITLLPLPQTTLKKENYVTNGIKKLIEGWGGVLYVKSQPDIDISDISI